MKRKILLVTDNMIAFGRKTRQLFQKVSSMQPDISCRNWATMLAFEGIEVICVFDAQYIPGVRQTYEEFNVGWSLPVRMRRQMTISGLGGEQRPSTKYQ